MTFNGGKGYSLRDVVQTARERVAGLKLPADVYVSFAGQAEAEREGQIRLAGLTALSIALIVAALTMAFRRRGLAAMVLINGCRRRYMARNTAPPNRWSAPTDWSYGTAR